METIPPSFTKSKLRADEEEDAQASKILEIINGRTVDASKMTEEPEDREVWSMEMGDDSVFYSDEEHAQWDKEPAILTRSGAKRWKDPVNSVADGDSNQQMETNPREKGNSEMEKEMNQWVIWTEEENQRLENLTTKRMHVSDPWESAAEAYVTPGKLGKTSGKTFVPQNRAAVKEDQVKKEEVMLEAGASNQHLCGLLNYDGNEGLNGDTKFPQRLSGTDTQTSSDLQPVGDVQAESVQNLRRDQSNLPPPKKSDCSAFNHLSSSKYSTVSYRRIRRGNTRQRVEEFEFLLTNKK